MPAIALGRFDDSFSLASFKAYLAEFISTLLSVFAGVGSAIAYAKLTSGAALDPSGLASVANCHGFALFVAVSVGANISRGHVNWVGSWGSNHPSYRYFLLDCSTSRLHCCMLPSQSRHRRRLGHSNPRSSVGCWSY